MYISEHTKCSEMNYKLIHDKTIQYIRSNSIKNRILKRNPKDYRLQSNKIYIEMHHIIPRSLGGLDINSNLIEVLPEEHIFLHMLRYKIYKCREDILAIRYMLNGYDNKSFLSDTKIALTKKIRMGYSWIRTHAQLIRSTHGWHTKDGVKKISQARKGKMPVVDMETGAKIGMVDVSHPNVISGKWVHHSKGKKQSKEHIEYKKNAFKGQQNPNASGLTEEYFIEKGFEMFKEFGMILSWGRMLELSESRGFKWIKSLNSRFGGLGLKGYYLALEKKTQTQYNFMKSRNILKKGSSLC